MSKSGKLRVLFIFRKRSPLFHSIENLFASVQRHLPHTIEYENLYLPNHEGVIGKFKNILFVLKQCAKIRKFDIVHITGDITYITPFVCGRKVVTYHDLGSLLSGRSILAQKLFSFFWVRLPVWSAAAVTAISLATIKEILTMLPVQKRKLRFIPNCIPDDWQDDEPFIRQEVQYVLTIGTKKNKNLERIIKACAGVDVVLIIVGKLNLQQRNLLLSSGLDYVVWTTLDYQQIKSLYSQVDIVLFPSLYEGFGLPILEAQTRGIPLITSGIEPMSSVAGRGALKVNPYDEQELRTAIEKLINDFALRQKLVELGRENVKKYFCSHISQEYAKLYKDLTKLKK